MRRSGRSAPLFPILVLLTLGVTACSKERPVPKVRTGPLFTLLPPTRTGVDFSNTMPENVIQNGLSYDYYYGGGGVAVGDLNGDGLPDIYLVSTVGPNHLYLNRGNMHFEDVTERAGVAGHPGWGTGVTFADVNGDGRLDIYLCYSGPYRNPDVQHNMLYINEGTKDGIPIFQDSAKAYGLDSPALSTQAVFFDYDGDGDLDMYLMNRGIAGYQDLDQLKAGHSPDQVDQLYRNDGGHFTNVTAGSGLADTDLGFGLGVGVADLNNDGRPDLYVSNDYSGQNYLYLNEGGGHFKEVMKKATGHSPFASMGMDIADVDGDGWLDVFTLEMAMTNHYDRVTSDLGTHGPRFDHVVAAGQGYQYAENALQWNRGDGPDSVPVFSEIANLAGVPATDWSWSALFADLDDDGRPDLLVTNGVASDMVNKDFEAYRELRTKQVIAKEGHVTPALIRELLKMLPRRKVSNFVFRNEGDLRFGDSTRAWGLDTASYSTGAAYADLDRDGDLDLVINNVQGQAFIYRNNSPVGGPDDHWLGISLDGSPPNRFGMDARVRVKAGGAWQLQEMQTTHGYLSSMEPVLHFGLGAATRVDSLEVRWPNGERQVLTNVKVDRYMTLHQKDAHPAPTGAAPPRPHLFVDASASLHPLPRNTRPPYPPDSTLRPYPTRHPSVAMATADVNGDGLTDFFFGGSGSEPSRIYLQRPDGSFEGRPVRIVDHRGEKLVAATMFDANGDGHPDLWVSSADTMPGAHGRARHRLYFGDGRGRFRPAPAGAVPPLSASGSVLVPGDYDGDGKIDLFVGDRIDPDFFRDPGRPSGSRLLRNVGGRFVDVTQKVAPLLSELRTVNDAAWADLNGDHRLDLLVAGEWMPIAVLMNNGKQLKNATTAAGLDNLTGWWQSLAVGDFDGDGDIDFIAGNMGENFPYHPTPKTPFLLYLGDFNGNGRYEAVPATFEDGRIYPWYTAERLGRMIPSITKRYPTNHLYGLATLPQVLGKAAIKKAWAISAGTMTSMYFENDGHGHFKAIPLPRAAQVSPITGMAVGDFDGDGHLDVVIGGNLYEIDSTAERQDAGVGLFLKGNGRGGFTVVSPQRSGILLRGETVHLARLTSRGSAPGVLVGTAGRSVTYIRAGGTR